MKDNCYESGSICAVFFDVRGRLCNHLVLRKHAAGNATICYQGLLFPMNHGGIPVAKWIKMATGSIHWIHLFSDLRRISRVWPLFVVEGQATLAQSSWKSPETPSCWASFSRLGFTGQILCRLEVGWILGRHFCQALFKVFSVFLQLVVSSCCFGSVRVLFLWLEIVETSQFVGYHDQWGTSTLQRPCLTGNTIDQWI